MRQNHKFFKEFFGVFFFEWAGPSPAILVWASATRPREQWRTLHCSHATWTVENKIEKEEEEEGRGTADRAVVRGGAGGGRRGGMAVVRRGRCWLFFLFLCIFLLPFSIFFSPSLRFYVLLLFSGSGGAASGSIVAVGDGSRRGMVLLPLYAETPDSFFFFPLICFRLLLFSLVLSLWSLFLFLSSFILCFKTNRPLLFFNSPL